jgi:alpha-amylase
VQVNPASAKLVVGDATVLSAVARDANGNALSRTISWNSAAPSIADVDPTGRVLGKAAGTTSVTASAGGASAPVTVEVTAPTAPQISALTGGLIGVNDPRCPNSAGNWSLYYFSFSFTDVNGDVTNTGSSVALSWAYQPGGSSGSAPWAVDSIAGTPYTGTVIVGGICQFWGSSTSITYTFTLTDSRGLMSNPLSVVLSRPAGANNIVTLFSSETAPSPAPVRVRK